MPRVPCCRRGGPGTLTAKRLVRRLAPRCRELGVPRGAGVSLRSSRWLTLGVDGSEDE